MTDPFATRNTPDSKLKILIFNWQDVTNPLAGGAEVHLHEVFERVAARGHEVTLYCHRFKGQAREEIRNGIRIIRRGGRFFFNFRVPFAYWGRFRKQRYDVVIDDVNKIPFYTPLFVSEPVQGITHHLFGKSIFLETAYPFALYVHLAEKLIKPIYRNVHFIIGSPSTHQEYLAWGFHPARVSIVPYCVNKSTYYPASAVQAPMDVSRASSGPDARRIGYFGRLKKYKSVDHLLQALQRLLPEFPDLRLEVIGDGDDRPRLEALAESLGIGTSVSFLGFIPEQDKAPRLQRMHCVVNTSSKEGWGLTVVEANACGTPCIAANVPGLRDSVLDGRTGLLYEYGNIDELIARLRRVLLEPGLRDSLSAEALRWADSFDWENATEETLRHIRATIARHAS